MSQRLTSFRFVLSIFVVLILTAAMFATWTDYLPALFHTRASASASSQRSAAIVQPRRSATIGVCVSAGPIEVEDGNTTAYATLAEAFDAISDGTHQGMIDVEVCGDTEETTTATLTASGINGASYSFITVRPVGGARTITGDIAGAIIRLNGADRVTIDGRQGGTGTARHLTVTNTSTASASAAVWLSSLGGSDGASRNTIRNLEISTGSYTSATYGIIMSGTTISTTSDGVGNEDNQFLFNRIVRARYGILTRGSPTNLNVNTIVTDNIIGPAGFGNDQIGKTGIFMQADTGAIVSRNTVQFVGCLEPQFCSGADRNGIAIGTDSWSVDDTTALTSSTYTVTKNIVHDVVEERSFSAAGIRIGTTQNGGATNNLIANNFVYNVRSNGFGVDQFVGIGISAGNGDRIVFNSISITGDMDPGAAFSSSQYGNAIRIPGDNGPNNANFTVMNNSIYMDVNSDSAGVHFYAITLSSSDYQFGTGGLNYNNYFVNQANPQMRTGALSSSSLTEGGGTPTTTEFQTLANWRLALTPPQDSNSIQANPLYVSNTSDLHIPSSSPNQGAGTTITGVIDDIDGNTRPATPDIGADEVFAPSAAGVSLSGRVTDASGRGIRNAIMMLEGGGLNEPRVIATGSLGYYGLDDLSVGTYILTINTKRHSFSVPTRVVTMFDNVADFNFVADPQE